MSGSGVTLFFPLVLVFLADLSCNGEDMLEVGRVEFVMKYCNREELQSLTHPDANKNSVTRVETATELLASGVQELLTKLRENTDSLLTIDTGNLEKLYKDITCSFGLFMKVGEDIMFRGRADVCKGESNYLDATEMTKCVISLSTHIESLFDKVVDYGETLTRQQRSDVIDIYEDMFHNFARLENGLRILAVDSKTDHKNTQKDVSEYMKESCPGGEELDKALKDKSPISTTSILRVINQPDLRRYMQDLTAYLSEGKDRTSEDIENVWKSLMCKMVPIYVTANHETEGGTTLCLNPELDYDDPEAVAECIRERIAFLETALPNMVNMKEYPYYDLATLNHVWYGLSDLQVGFAQLLRLAKQDT